MTNDVDACILCGICLKRCPCGAIAVDKPARTWSIDRFRCVQCGSVRARVPRRQCLAMEPTYTSPATEKCVELSRCPSMRRRLRRSLKNLRRMRGRVGGRAQNC